MRPSSRRSIVIDENPRDCRPIAERDAELARFDEASPEERMCLMDFTIGDIDFALTLFGYTDRENVDWAMIWGYCHRQYRQIDQNKIDKGAQAHEDLIQRSLRSKPALEQARPSARERLRLLGLARSMSRPAGASA